MAFAPTLGHTCMEKAGMEFLQQTDWQLPKAESLADVIRVRGHNRGSYSFVIICSANSFSLGKILLLGHRFFLNYSHRVSNIGNKKKSSCCSYLQCRAEIGGVIGVVVIVLADLIFVIQRAGWLRHLAELQRQDQGSGKEKP